MTGYISELDEKILCNLESVSAPLSHAAISDGLEESYYLVGRAIVNLVARYYLMTVPVEKPKGGGKRYILSAKGHAAVIKISRGAGLCHGMGTSSPIRRFMDLTEQRVPDHAPL